MISAEFAPNEQLDDALQSIATLFKPWQWKKGDSLQKVKKKIKKFFPHSNIFLFLTGRSALYQLLKVLNLEKNSEVLVQGFTCEAVVLPIIANNLKPVYVDIESKTLSMDIYNLKKKFTKNAKVLILQHTFGLTPINRMGIHEFVKKHNLILIEDLAHGFTANMAMKQSFDFTQDKSNNSFFLLSFGRSKSLSSLFGGAIVSYNAKINQELQSAEKTMLSPSNLFILKALLYKPLTYFIKKTYHLYLGRIIHKITKIFHLILPEITKKEKAGQFDPLLNKTYPNAFAKLLLTQLNKHEKTENVRKTAVQTYENMLNELSAKFPFNINNHALLRFPLLVNKREEVIKKYKKKHIYLGRWYDQVVAPKSISLDKFMYRVGECPRAEEICEKIINLPTNVKEKEARKIIKILNDAYPVDTLL